ncbi:MAG: lipid-A-disaccharide synthase [bacterium]
MKYYLIAGEASGDLHGSNLMKALKRRDNQAQFRCWGGDLMQEAGGTLVRHYRDLSFMGFWEVFIHLRTILGNLRFCEKDLLDYHPDVVILIDYPGFNLRIAKFASTHQFRVFYYISPQLWAWRSSRVKIIQAHVSKMFVILPFEEEFYKKFGYPVDFVGHPLLDVIHADRKQASREEFLLQNKLPDNKPIIALLPGSRKQEIQTMLRRMIQVIPFFGDYQFVVAAAPSIRAELYDSILNGSDARVVFNQTYDLLSQSTAALVTSGTATLEVALFGVPEVVCYRGSALSFWIARRIVNVRFISLVNLIMDREVVKELIQHFLIRDNMIEELRKILDPLKAGEMKDNFRQLTGKLGGSGASDRVAGRIIQYLQDS